MAKSVNLLVCFSVILGQDGLGESGCRIFKANIFLERSVEIACFFECSYQKLSVDREILGWVLSKMGVATRIIGLLN